MYKKFSLLAYICTIGFVEAAAKIAGIVARGQNRVFLESDTLMMNLTTGFNNNLERKTAHDYQ